MPPAWTGHRAFRRDSKPCWFAGKDAVELSDSSMAAVWEALTSAPAPLTAAELVRISGLSLVKVQGTLGKMAGAGLLDRIEPTEADHEAAKEETKRQRTAARAAAARRAGEAAGRTRQAPPEVLAVPRFKPRLRLDPMTYAVAVEIGVPLMLLERTAVLSKSSRQKAFRLAEAGKVDDHQEAQQAKARRVRRSVIRGRAASKAAASDLARLMDDVHAGMGVSPSVKARRSKAPLAPATPVEAVRQEMLTQVREALDALVSAMEGAR